MTTLAILASISGLLLGFSGLFQAHKIFKTKSAGDIAPATYWVGIVGSVIWILYGLELRNYTIVIPNVTGFCVTGLILTGYCKYGIKRKKKNGAWWHRLISCYFRG